MTKDMGIVEAAAFAPAFIDKVCFQASWVPCPVAELGRGKHCSGEEDLAESQLCKLDMHMYGVHSGTCHGWRGSCQVAL